MPAPLLPLSAPLYLQWSLLPQLLPHALPPWLSPQPHWDQRGWVSQGKYACCLKASANHCHHCIREVHGLTAAHEQSPQKEELGGSDKGRGQNFQSMWFLLGKVERSKLPEVSEALENFSPSAFPSSEKNERHSSPKL